MGAAGQSYLRFICFRGNVAIVKYSRLFTMIKVTAHEIAHS